MSAVALLAAVSAVAALAASARAGGLYATSTSVSCQPTSVAVGTVTVCTATVTDTVSRRVTPTGTVAFASDAPGSFGGVCALAPSATAAAASCQESYSPSAVASGTHAITAGYRGDARHSASLGTTAVTVGAAPPTQTLTVSLAGAGTVAGAAIACPGSCSSAYPADTVVSLTATPAVGSTFDGWSGACTGTGACSVTMSADQAVTAAFGAGAMACDTVSRRLPGAAGGAGTPAGPPIAARCCLVVSTRLQLIDALASGSTCIYVADDARIDLAVGDQRTGARDSLLQVPDGVTLESGRSARSPGGLLYMSHRVLHPSHKDGPAQFIMLDLGSNTRITGLRLRGYNQWSTPEADDSTQAIMIDGRADSGHAAVHDDLIDNNEIYGWPGVGVNVVRAPAGGSSIRITGNFIHNNVECGLGYGVGVGGSGFPLIDRNVFDWNRHDVSSDGLPGTGYRAESNLVLTGGPTCLGHANVHLYNQHFDVHGTGSGGYGKLAGRLYQIRNNTIRGAQEHALGIGVRPAFELRGTPVKAIFADNAVVHDEGDAIYVHNAGPDEDALKQRGRLVESGNRYKVMTARELAVGHFADDGCSDVFQATGAVWVYSPCGRGIWRFLKQDSHRLGDLAFGDFDGDGRTDVFTQSGHRWRVSYGGTGDWTPLPAGSSIPMKEYRFGDFDGDGKTDIFRANGTQFFYSSGGATRWKPLAFSHFTIEQLRFGSFQQPGRTDVFSLANGHWSVSYGGATRWRPLNLQRSSDLTELAFADFDGDGRTDIARCEDKRAEVSRDGFTRWHPLGFPCRHAFPGMLFGSFTGSTAADALITAVVTTDAVTTTPLNRYRLSRAGRTSFFAWSPEDML